MGLAWAVGWGACGLLIGVTSVLFPGLPGWDAFFRIFDAPLPALGMIGFFGGALFSIVLGVAGRNRRLHELSLRRFTAWGAAAGFLLSLVPAAFVVLGLGTFNPSVVPTVWHLTAIIAVPLTLLGAASAAGTLVIARKFEQGESLGASDAAQVQAPAIHVKARPRDRDRTSP
jgi:hypothetical protein